MLTFFQIVTLFIHKMAEALCKALLYDDRLKFQNNIQHHRKLYNKNSTIGNMNNF